MRSGIVAVVLSACALGLPSVATAQGSGMTDCDLATKGSASDELIGGIEIRRGGGGITVTCRARKITLLADSGEMIGSDRVELFGHVRYKEPSRIELQSDFLTYFVREERILVRGNVVASLPSGSTLVGPQATYLRAAPRIRTIEELTAIDNPTVTIVAKGDSGQHVSVNAATIFMRGDSLIYASKKVFIIRKDLVARGDSAFLDGRSGTETMRLMFTPSVEGTQGKKFKLEGEVIDAYSRSRKLERVIARGKGHATSQDMNIVADTIDLRMSNDVMERAIAWNHTGQARATSTAQSITADSIDVIMPNQKVRVVYAVRHARAEADADTIRFRTTEKDWLRGETVVAWFDSTGTKDTSATPPIKRILATHSKDSAQAYYHMAANDTSIRNPAISYVRGREIRLDFDDNRRVGQVTVVDSVVGLYLEPKRDTATVAAGKAAGSQPVLNKKPPATPPPRVPPPPAVLKESRPDGT